MKFIVLIFISFNLSLSAQLAGILDNWNKETQKDIRLLPKYGHQVMPDSLYISESRMAALMAKQFNTIENKSATARQVTQLGFNALVSGELKKAMQLFNLAYFIDKNYEEIYRGFASVYINLGLLQDAEKLYLEGYHLNSYNTELLSDLGTCYISLFYNSNQKKFEYMPLALEYLLKSNTLNPQKANNLFKISLCYFNLSECDKAQAYFNQYLLIEKENNYKEYSLELQKKCNQSPSKQLNK